MLSLAWVNSRNVSQKGLSVMYQIPVWLYPTRQASHQTCSLSNTSVLGVLDNASEPSEAEGAGTGLCPQGWNIQAGPVVSWANVLCRFQRRANFAGRECRQEAKSSSWQQAESFEFKRVVTTHVLLVSQGSTACADLAQCVATWGCRLRPNAAVESWGPGFSQTGASLPCPPSSENPGPWAQEMSLFSVPASCSVLTPALLPESLLPAQLCFF